MSLAGLTHIQREICVEHLARISGSGSAGNFLLLPNLPLSQAEVLHQLVAIFMPIESLFALSWYFKFSSTREMLHTRISTLFGKVHRHYLSEKQHMIVCVIRRKMPAVGIVEPLVNKVASFFHSPLSFFIRNKHFFPAFLNTFRFIWGETTYVDKIRKTK